MMAWLNPAALLGLTLAAGPVIVHLLRRRRSRRMPFPSLRFVQPSRAAAVRLYAPADWPLLALRMAIITLAVLALAQPIVVTSRRLASWNSRFARVVIVDRSALPGADQEAAEAIAAAELRTAAFATRLDAQGVAEALPQAVATLDSFPPARREIVVVSPVRRGSLGTKDIEGVPTAIGVRFAQVDGAVASATVPGMNLLGYDDVAARGQSMTLGQNTTAVTLATTPTETPGLRVIAPAGSERDVTMLLRAVAMAGSPAPSAEQRIAVFFEGETPQSLEPLRLHWMLQAVTRLANDVELRRTANDPQQPSAPVASVPGATVLLRDRGGRPLLSAGAAKSADGGEELVLQGAVPAGSFIAAAIVRAALIARHGSVAIPEREIARTPASQLEAWTRPPALVTVENGRHAGFSDARWVWALVLLLLSVETFARRARVEVTARVDADAA